jgi:GxxExxY protein
VLSDKVIGLAIEVHRALGPGLLESVYEQCLCAELAEHDLPYARQVALPVVYKSTHIDAGFRIDIVVAGELVLELKAVDVLLPVHSAQVLPYLRIGGYPLGLLMNFNTVRLKDGLRRFVR